MKTLLRLRGAGRASSAKSISPGSGLDTRFALFPSGAGCFEAVSKKLSTVLGIPGVTATGPSIDLGTTGSRYAPSIVVPSAAFGTGDFAVCVAGTFTPTTTIGVAFSNDANQNGGDYQWRLQPNNNGSSASSGAFAFQTYGGSFVSAGADALFTAGEYCVFLGVRRGTTVELWKNGVLVASNTGTAQNVSSSETQSIGFGWGLTTTYVAGGHRTLGFGIAGTVQPTVAAALSRDPLHYLPRASRPLYFDLGAGGGDLNITASLGTASATGYAATVDRQRTIAASLGTATAQGYAATINRSRDIAASLGTATASGYGATVNRQRNIAASLGAATAQGYGATISFGNDLTIAASLGFASADGYQANVNLRRDIAASLGTAAALGYQASISDTDPLHGFTQDQLDFLVAYMEANMAIPTAAEIATAIVTTAIDGTTTLAESLRLSNAVLGGKVSGAGTGTETFRNPADTKDRLVVTVDSSGNRTAITLDLD